MDEDSTSGIACEPAPSEIREKFKVEGVSEVCDVICD